MFYFMERRRSKFTQVLHFKENPVNPENLRHLRSVILERAFLNAFDSINQCLPRAFLNDLLTNDLLTIKTL